MEADLTFLKTSLVAGSGLYNDRRRTPSQSMNDPSPRLFRFGVFEADPATGELRKAGQKIRLQDQPFRILLLLLEHPGEVVSRAELRQKIWGETHVDFEEGLNTAVRKLR